MQEVFQFTVADRIALRYQSDNYSFLKEVLCPFRVLWTELIVAVTDRISETNAAVNDELYVQPLWALY